MKTPSRSGARAASGGFTIAEAAVTIAIVALVLTTILQSLEGAKISALHTMLQKSARELGLEMLGEIEAGRWQDEIDSGSSGTFANRDEPGVTWELALGDDAFPDRPDDSYNDQYRPFDNFRARDEWRDQNSDSSETEDENEDTQPFEKVKLRVRFPKVRELSNELILERWIRWGQVYGEEEEQEVPIAADPNSGTGAGGAGNTGTGGALPGGTNK